MLYVCETAHMAVVCCLVVLSCGKKYFIYTYIETLMVLQVSLLLGACICSEYGERWYEMGTLDRKQNSFDDFQAAAEYLIESKYTTPQR